MQNTLSERALQYLHSLRRWPFVQDDNIVIQALEAEGIPITEPLLAFHRTFAGFVAGSLTYPIVYGLVHPNPKYFSPLTASAFDEGGIWYVSCADMYPFSSHDLDQYGRFYGGDTCESPTVSSFFLKIEQDAFIYAFCRETGARMLRLYEMTEEAVSLLIDRVSDKKIASLSDEYSQILADEKTAVWHCGGKYEIWSVVEA